jgi:hypothetical protein
VWLLRLLKRVTREFTISHCGLDIMHMAATTWSHHTNLRCRRRRRVQARALAGTPTALPPWPLRLGDGPQGASPSSLVPASSDPRCLRATFGSRPRSPARCHGRARSRRRPRQTGRTPCGPGGTRRGRGAVTSGVKAEPPAAAANRESSSPRGRPGVLSWLQAGAWRCAGNGVPLALPPRPAHALYTFQPDKLAHPK